MAFHEWMDQRQLQNLQRIFCDITGVSVLCLDEQKKLIAANYGKPGDVELLSDFLENSQIQALLERTGVGTLEEQITEKWESGPGIVGVISVRTQNSVFCYWIVFSSEISDEKNPHFDRVMDCIREGSRVLMDSHMNQEDAQAKSRASFMEQQRMQGSLQDITATTEVVQLAWDGGNSFTGGHSSDFPTLSGNGDHGYHGGVLWKELYLLFYFYHRDTHCIFFECRQATGDHFGERQRRYGRANAQYRNEGAITDPNHQSGCGIDPFIISIQTKAFLADG